MPCTSTESELRNRLSWPIEVWPTIDQEAWRKAQEPTAFLDEEDHPAADWSAKRRRIVVQAYGQWLSWLYRHNALDELASPGDRISPELAKAFIWETGDRVAENSLSMMIGGILRMLDVIEPDADWEWLRRYYNRLKERARPSRNKRELVVPSRDLVDLGDLLMETCKGAGRFKYHEATAYRDGLMIAFLAAFPLRFRNFSALELGTSLTHGPNGYRVRFSKKETKTSTPIDEAWPPALHDRLETYLTKYRPMLLARRKGADLPTNALWVSREGNPMGRGIYDQICKRTEDHLGKRVTPHMFRDCAATTVVAEAPESTPIIMRLLGHTTLQTAEKHYIQATGLQAARRHLSVIAELRQKLRDHDTKLQEASCEQ